MLVIEWLSPIQKPANRRVVILGKGAKVVKLVKEGILTVPFIKNPMIFSDITLIILSKNSFPLPLPPSRLRLGLGGKGWPRSSTE